MLSLRQIEVFRAFMTTGTVSGTGRLLGISQPATSNILYHMQDKLGVKLFSRVRGRLLPTPEAQTLYHEIEHTWAGIERVRQTASNLKKGHLETLRVFSSPSLAINVLPDIIMDLLKSREQLSVTLELPAPTQVVRAITENRADIAFATHQVDHPGIGTEKIGSLRIVCVMPPDHQLSDLEVITVNDIKFEPMVSHTPGFDEKQTLDDKFIMAGMQTGSRVHVNSGQNACRFVQSGAGIALVDELSAAPSLFPTLLIKLLKPETRLEVHALWDLNRPLSATATELKNQVAMTLKQIQQQDDVS